MVKYAGRGLSVEFETAPVGQCTQFGEVGSERDLIDASAYGDDWKDYVLGQQDGVEVDMVVALDPADSTHDAIFDSYVNDPDAVTTWSLSHSTSGWSVDISARILRVTQGGQLGDLFQMSVGLKIVEPGVVLTGS